jgi:hypothetical protein
LLDDLLARQRNVGQALAGAENLGHARILHKAA